MIIVKIIGTACALMMYGFVFFAYEWTNQGRAFAAGLTTVVVITIWI